MSKVLLINGSPHEYGCTYTALSELAATLEKNGIQTEMYHIGTKPMAGCIACKKCFNTGKCIFEDGVNEISARLDEFDGIAVGSPVYYAGPSGQLCSFLDRLFYTSGKRLKGKPACCVVSCRRGGASAAFDRLNKYFTICNMPVVPSQYWNQVHGSCPEDVLRDEEGLQTVRTLAQNMAWMIKSLKNSERPAYEPTVRTNFIR